MKIAILVANPYIDSTWTDPRVEKQAKALSEAGHTVIILGTGKEGEDLPCHEIKDGLQVIRRPTPLEYLYTRWVEWRESHKWQDDENRQVCSQRKIQSSRLGLINRISMLRHNLNMLLYYGAIVPEAVRHRADVYIGHDLVGLRPAYLAARLTGASLAYDSRELWTERTRGVPYHSWQKALVTWEEKMLARRCDLVIVVSQSVARILAERYEIPEPLVIPNVQPWVEAVPSPEIRAQLNGGTGKRVVIFVGFLSPGRGVEQVVEAAQYLNEDMVVSIVGDGILRSELEMRVKQENLQERVRFIGWVVPDQLPIYIASADLGISPMSPNASLNNYYSLDNKSFQYIMAGIPLVVNDQPEKRRLVEKYRIGAVFDEKDPKDIARAITQLVSDPLEYEEMRARCRKAAREELNWGVVSQELVSAIEKLAAK